MKKLAESDPETQSTDLVAENVEQLKALFPEAVTEGKVDFEVLKALLGGAVDEREEKYGLNWHGKRRARQLALTPSIGTLRPCPEESVEWDTTQNLMIEGDNLEVLKLLQKSYAGKVKLIYIDPPYNTGKDFVYPDDFRDGINNYLSLTNQSERGIRLSSNVETSGRFHAEWLNMLYPRLKLSRNLLREDGVIFVSIDDHEVSNLKSMLDEVFGGENFVCQICVVSNPRGRQSEIVASTHEYLLAYARNVERFVIRGQSLSEEQIQEYKFQTPDGRKYRTRGLRHRGNASRRIDRPNMYFSIFVNPVSREVSLEKSEAFSVEVVPIKSDGEEGRWEWGPETARQRLELLEGVFINGRGEWDVFQREFLEVADGELRTRKWKSVWDEKNINYQNGRTELSELFGEVPFDYPKPIYLLRKIIEGLTDGHDLIVDFFAGSGTTASAMFEANRDDRCGRRFLLVQLPEATGRVDFKTIADITKERLRRAASKIGEQGLLFKGDLGFRIFKLDSSNIRAWEPKSSDLGQTLLESVEHLKTGRTEPDILYELLLKLGLDLCVPIEKRSLAGKEVHGIAGGVLFACLAEQISSEEVEPLAQGIIAWHQELAPAGDTTCVFRDSAFANDVAKTNLAAILAQHGLGKVRSL